MILFRSGAMNPFVIDCKLPLPLMKNKSIKRKHTDLIVMDGSFNKFKPFQYPFSEFGYINRSIYLVPHKLFDGNVMMCWVIPVRPAFYEMGSKSI